MLHHCTRALCAALTATALLFGPLASAQMDLGTHFMHGTLQANRTNPAFMPAHRLTVGLPGVHNSLFISNITFADLTTTNSAGNNIIDAEAIIGKLDARNRLLETLDVETFSLAVNNGKWLFSFGHSIRFNALVDYPKTLPQLIWQGNAQFIGQEVEFGPDLAVGGYHEVAAGAAFRLGSLLTVGARLKHLSGIADVTTTRTGLRLFTDDDVYQLRLTADYEVSTSSALQYNSLEDLDFNFNFGRVDARNLFGRNTGVAFDLGATAELGRLRLSASLLDIGRITWREEARQYRLQGEFAFEGFDIARELLRDSTNFGSVIDSLRQSYTVEEGQESYTTVLPAHLYISAQFQLTERLRLGALFYSGRYQGVDYPALALGTNYQLLPWWNVGASWSWRHRAATNLGLNTALKLGPVQVVAATDHIVAAFRPKQSHRANLRVGLNVVLAKRERGGE